MTVSILVPIYNGEKYIERSARSFFEQSYTDLNYIFVNDCSTDKSVEILLRVLDDYPKRKPSVRIVNHSVNRGLAAVRNTAVNLCSSEFLIHADSDDWMERTCVAKSEKNRP